MHSRRALPVQVVPAELLYAPSSSAVNFTQTYPMDYTYNDYNEPLRRRFRAAAHAVLPAPPHRPSAPPLRTALYYPRCTLDAPLPSAALRRLRRPPLPSAALRRPLPPSAALPYPPPPSLTLRRTLPPSAGARRGRGPCASCAAATRARGVAAVAARLLAHPWRACARHRQDRRPTRDAAWSRVVPPGQCPSSAPAPPRGAPAGGFGWAQQRSQRAKGRDRATGHPATASGARASRLQSHRLHRLRPTRCRQRPTSPLSTHGSQGRPTRWSSSRQTR